MEYLLDTVTLVRYLTDDRKISAKVRSIFDRAEQGEHEFIISTISLMEILYLSERNRISIDLEEVLKKIRESTIYKVVSLSVEIISTAKRIEFYELHDRMILATAKYLDIPIISPDEKFIEFPGIETIWR
jgi:predicted nucleic acid-binding protein